jgi:type VI secretion system protein ImpH
VSSPRRDGASVLEAIAAAPWSFGFFQALRRIECAFRDRPRLGEGRHPSEEPIRLAQEATLAFSPSTIVALERGAETPRLVNPFLGLFGPNGPLPLHLTEYVRDRVRNSGDRAFARFVDMFHHRALSLFYRAFAAAEPTINRDRPESDRFAFYVGALAGHAGTDDRSILYHAGWLGRAPKNVEGLRSILSEELGVEVAIEEFVGEWIDLPEASRWQLGRSALGAATLGARAWMCQGKFRVVLGPLGHRQFEDLLPDGRGFAKLEALVRAYVGQELSFDVRLVVDEPARRPWCLGQARLGYSASLGRGKGHGSVIVRSNGSRPQESRHGGN